MSEAATGRGAGVLADRVVLVTGANGGLGEAAARACAQAGATVVLLGRRVPRLNKLYDILATLGPEPAAYPLDMEGAGPEDYAQLATSLESQLGRLDGILHAALAFKGLTPLANTDPLEFAREIHVNLTAPMLLTQACLPLLRRAPDAAVVFVLDDLERIGRAYWGGYAVAKHGLLGLMRVLHDETEQGGVRVSALEPGPMRSGFRAKAFMESALRDIPAPTAYAAACVELLSPAGASHRGAVHRVRADA
ncbi:SDR family NAD(P)-dependent oxidoreductase [Coralloluteibacterium stylophorae]|uniref:SDR family NAD(P)-dependent oxidoreductase n=1 Tax=Coralloluteibacterium stylophorae TaxID=1776034 RepID=A0A8J7VUT4_9GAMM|nr:SDR family NAD(P)-dependent oxidoreductase [Coralloluteibacterium stylophorae]MBS7456668.1 SDR family NAD(P)-dependent oxidoreductase [Coralloluteibacterium stylophorae]